MPEPGVSTVLYGTLVICKSTFVYPLCKLINFFLSCLRSRPTAGVSSFGTACWTTYRGTPNSGMYVATAAANSALTGLTFFSIREYAVSPILTRIAPWAQYAERRRNLGIDTPSGDTLTEEPIQPSLRTKNLLDSGISGALSGGLLIGLRSGASSVPRGSLLGAGLSTSAQYIFNELNLTRLRYIARRNEERATEGTKSRQPTFNPRTGKQEVQELPRSWTDMFLVLFGLAPLSDEEYLAKLRRQREVFLKKITQLEATVAMEKEEKRLKEESSKS